MIDASEQQRSARIERVWLDTTRPRAGQDATVYVAMRNARGEEIVKQVPIQLPANTAGSLQLVVADAVRTTADDRRETRGADMQRVSQMIRTFNARAATTGCTSASPRRLRRRRQRRASGGPAAVGAGGARG